MAHVRKMELVDPRLLETLRTPIQSPIDTNLGDLDFEMTGILDNTGIDVSEKVRLYNQALLRYNDMAKMSATKPTPVVVVKEKETPATTDIMVEVVTTLPKALQEKGRQLVSRLKTAQWNDRGALLHEGMVVPGSNVVDLVHDLLRKRKTSDPIGWQQFGSQMRAANIPRELFGNVARRRHIQQRKRTLIPKQKKGRRVQLPGDWESYLNQTVESRSSQHGSSVHGSGNHKRRRRHTSISSHLADDVTAVVSSVSGLRRTMGRSKLQQRYYDPKRVGSYGGVTALRRVFPKLDVEGWLSEQDTHTHFTNRWDFVSNAAAS